MCFTKEARSQQTTGFFVPGSKTKGRYEMKFLIAVILIRLLVEAIVGKKDVADEKEEMDNHIRIIHPAEFLLR